MLRRLVFTPAKLGGKPVAVLDAMTLDFIALHGKKGQLERTSDSQGQVLVRGEATAVAATGNKLVFRLSRDQSDLPEIIRSLRVMIQELSLREL